MNLIIKRVQRQLEFEGFEVEVIRIEKEAYHCKIKFPELLYKQGLSNIQQEKLLIKLDTIFSRIRIQTGYKNN